MRPLSKFLCIKAVIFLSFLWVQMKNFPIYPSVTTQSNNTLFSICSQSCAIDMLIQLGILVDPSPPERPLSADSCLQDLLICVEMFAAAVAHLFAFSHRPFIDLAAIRHSACHSFMRLIDFSDERSDITDSVTQICMLIRPNFKKIKLQNFWYNFAFVMSFPFFLTTNDLTYRL